MLGSEELTESSQLLSPEIFPLELYWQRWYILALFCMSSILEQVAMNCFAPIYDSLEFVFGWDQKVGCLVSRT